ncbi:MAG: protein phosphatase 2C domain-containing protein [Chloroflexota bacterium]|nr:protein phosphatase 2C domain-containing protein [Chloroflexota bacterium]
MAARVRAGGFSDRGKSSQCQEDAWAVIDVPVLAPAGVRLKGSLLIAADGAGGPGVGDVASQMVIAAVVQTYNDSAEMDVKLRLREAIGEANRRIHEAATADPAMKGMSSTVTCAVVWPDRLFVANVGNGRAYLLRQGSFQQITKDHSVAAEKARNGQLTAEQARVSPENAILTRSLGPLPEVPIDFFTQDLVLDDVVVVSTDGLHGVVSDDAIQPIAEIPEDPYLLCQELVNGANAMDGPDNITVLLAQLVPGRGPNGANGANGAAAAATGGATGEAGAPAASKEEQTPAAGQPVVEPTAQADKSRRAPSGAATTLGARLTALVDAQGVYIAAGIVSVVLFLALASVVILGIVQGPPPATPEPRPSAANGGAPTAGSTAATPTPALPKTPAPTPTATLPAFVPKSMWYLAASGPASTMTTTTFVLVNTGMEPLVGRISLYTEGAEQRDLALSVPAQSRRILDATSLNIANAFGLRFAGDQAFYLESVEGARGKGVRFSTGAEPARRWCLPIVDQRPGYTARVSVANYNGAAARVNVVFMGEGGFKLTWEGTVSAQSRISLSTDQVPALALYYGGQRNRPLAAVVESDLPVVVEHGAVANSDSAAYVVGSGSSLSRTWYLPEASSGANAGMSVGILYPDAGRQPAKVLVTFLPEGREAFSTTYSIDLQSPLHLSVRSPITGLATAAIVEADQPVAVERLTTYERERTAFGVAGVPALATEWFLPEASTVAPRFTGLTILNPQTVPVEVTLTFYRQEGPLSTRGVAVGPLSRVHLDLSQFAPESLMGLRVQSALPVAVDRVVESPEVSGGVVSAAIPGRTGP